jgi:hypothetical protein
MCGTCVSRGKAYLLRMLPPIVDGDPGDETAED